MIVGGLAVLSRLSKPYRATVVLWCVRNRRQSLQRIHSAGGRDVSADDLELVAELLLGAAHRTGGT